MPVYILIPEAMRYQKIDNKDYFVPIASPDEESKEGELAKISLQEAVVEFLRNPKVYNPACNNGLVIYHDRYQREAKLGVPFLQYTPNNNGTKPTSIEPKEVYFNYMSRGGKLNPLSEEEYRHSMRPALQKSAIVGPLLGHSRFIYQIPLRTERREELIVAAAAQKDDRRHIGDCPKAT
jgi:hypothetical protein